MVYKLLIAIFDRGRRELKLFQVDNLNERKEDNLQPLPTKLPKFDIKLTKRAIISLSLLYVKGDSLQRSLLPQF